MNIREIQQARAKVAREIARLTEATEALRAQEIQLAAMEAELRRRLTSGNSGSTVVASMETDHRLAISKGRVARTDKKFTKAMADKGFTITSLAEACGVHKSAMSRYRAGLRETPEAIRARVFELIGWPTNAWPKLGA